MSIKPLETLLAIKAIGLAPGLKASDRAIGCAIIEHFNRRDRQCDPGLARLAALAGYSGRTVIRAVERLVQHHILLKDRHGGHFNRNSYTPNWSGLQQIRVNWDKRFLELSTPHPSAASQRQPRHVSGDAPVTQTFRSNLKEKGGSAKRATRTPKPKRLSPSSTEAAASEAERRWTTALTKVLVRTPVAYAAVIEAINDDIRRAVTEAEVRQRGSGLRTLIGRLEDLDLARAAIAILRVDEDSSLEPRVLPRPPPAAVVSYPDDTSASTAQKLGYTKVIGL